MSDQDTSYADRAQKWYDGSSPDKCYDLVTDRGATYPLPPGLAAMLDYGRLNGDLSIAELRGISDWVLDCLNEALLPRKTTKTIGSAEAIQSLIADTAIAYTQAANANPDAATLAAHRDRWPCLVPRLADPDGNKAFEEHRKALGIGKLRLRVGSPVAADGITPRAGKPKKRGPLANQIVSYFFEAEEDGTKRSYADSNLVPLTKIASGWTRPRSSETAEEWVERVLWPRVLRAHIPALERDLALGYYCSRSHPELDPTVRRLLEQVGLVMGKVALISEPKRLEPHFKAVHYLLADWGISELCSFFRGQRAELVSPPASDALDVWTCERAELIGGQWLEWYRTNFTNFSGEALAADYQYLSREYSQPPFWSLRSLGSAKGGALADLSLEKKAARVADSERFEMREKHISDEIRNSLLRAARSLLP